MIDFRRELKVLLASRPIDFRCGIHGLVALVSEALQGDPYCGDIFVFRSKRNDRLKLIVWDGSGMLLVTKWLEGGHFTFPPIRDGVVTLSATQFSILFAGLDWSRVPSRAVRRPTKVA